MSNINLYTGLPQDYSGDKPYLQMGNQYQTSGVQPTMYQNVDFNIMSWPQNAFTQALATGQAGFTIPNPLIGYKIELPDGDTTVTALSWAAAGEQNSGLYRAGASDYKYLVGGSSVTEWLSSEFRVNYLTAGSVLFAGTSGKVNQDNPNLFWDDTNNRLGIGNNAPAVALDVQLPSSGVHLRLGATGATTYTDFQNAPGAMSINPTSNRLLISPNSSTGGSGVTCWIDVYNTGSGAGTNALVQTRVDAPTDEDPYFRCRVDNVSSFWSFGLDNSDSDKFKISRASTLGTNDYVSIYTTGDVAFGTGSFYWDNANKRLTVDVAYIYCAGTQNLFIGKTAGNLTLAGNQNVGIGESALASLTTAAGQFNTAVGYQAAMALTSGHSITAVGTQALSACTTGINNSAFAYSQPKLTTGQQNTSFGDNSMTNALTNVSCSAFGYNALFTSTADSNNIAIGANALFTLNGANNNTAIGIGALTLNQTGANNTGVGQAVLGAITNGGNNCGLGQAAGGTLTTGDHGTFLGTAADANGVGYSYACAIGAGAIVGASSTMALGGTSTAAVKVVINGTTAGARLDVIDASAAQLRLSNVSASKYAEFSVDSSGNLSLGQAGGGTLVTFTSLSLALGTTPATAGTLRIPNNAAIDSRNAANTSNLNLIFADGSNFVNVGVNAIFDTSGNLSIGTTPATSGILRVPNNTAINSRNNANSSNVQLIANETVNSVADIVRMGPSSAGCQLVARSAAGTPTTSDIPSGQWALWRDTSGATTKLYYNNAGTLQSVALT